MSYNILQIYCSIGWVRVLRFITLSVKPWHYQSEFSDLLRYRLSQSSQVYYVIGWVITFYRFITLLVELEFSGLLRYRLSHDIIGQSSQIYYVIGWVRVLRFITLSVESVLRFITLLVELEFSGLLRYWLSYNIIQIYYVIGRVRVLRFITLSVQPWHYQSEFSDLLRYWLRYNIISQVYYIIGWDVTLSVRVYHIISGGITLLVDSFHNHSEYSYTISWTITLSVRDYYIISWIITLSAKGLLYCYVLQNCTIRKSEYARKWNFQFLNFELPLPLNETAIHCDK